MTTDGVIWCPSCNSVLRWHVGADGVRRVDEQSFQHLKYQHGRMSDSRVVADPPSSAVTLGDRGA